MRNRERLLETGAEVTLRAWELGENARLALADLKKELMLQSSRQEQILKIAGTVSAEVGERQGIFRIGPLLNDFSPIFL